MWDVLIWQGPTGSSCPSQTPQSPPNPATSERFGWEGTSDPPRTLPIPAPAALGPSQGTNQLCSPLCRRELALCPRPVPPGGAWPLGFPLHHQLHAGWPHHAHPHLHRVLHDSSTAPGELAAPGGSGDTAVTSACPCTRSSSILGV